MSSEYAYLSSAVLLTAYIPVNGSGSRVASSLVVIMILPPLFRYGMKALFTRNAPKKFMRIIRSKSDVSISASESSIYTPAK